MFESYLFPIGYAFLAFPIAAALFTMPFLIVQYRRHGYIHMYRALLLYLLLLYLLNALFLVILPMPASLHNEPPNVASYVQLIPFRFIGDIARETAVQADNPSTYWHLLTERAFLQVVFNVLLTVPFGMFLRYYFRVRSVTCSFATLALSLLFEITQVTGIYGLFDYPYRLFDVDDLMTNTAGGMIGFAAAAWLSAHLPRIDKLDERVDLTKKRVSYTRRAVALALDGLVLLPVLAVLAVMRTADVFPLLAAAYFIGLPYAAGGRTFGKWAVRIRLRGMGEGIRVRDLLVRYGLLYGPATGVPALGLIGLPPAFLGLYLPAMFLYYAFIAFDLLRGVLNRSRFPFHDRKAGTGHVIDPARGTQHKGETPAKADFVPAGTKGTL
ncbi:teicoplanin resistance protein VanZ [Cohnella sp. CFH 77786]|uniref:VanZ family protein n=1 Tax=Cohnella sp. CFH 77786 TaxID=2662265 RepID=UPI001C609E2D|nr:VanZ family protein [Cohnella sp. CFH 77786]MBW5449378.1 teicoplanin resistance protein VanZ [Cohnella sp. CFH 77786]